MSDSSMAMGDKMLARATAGHDMARPSQASPASVDSASGASGQSLNNQTGGQDWWSRLVVKLVVKLVGNLVASVKRRLVE